MVTNSVRPFNVFMCFMLGILTSFYVLCRAYYVVTFRFVFGVSTSQLGLQ
jgi:hypothetical protein